MRVPEGPGMVYLLERGGRVSGVGFGWEDWEGEGGGRGGKGWENGGGHT